MWLDMNLLTHLILKVCVLSDASCILYNPNLFIKTRTVVATSNILFDKEYLSKNQDLL